MRKPGCSLVTPQLSKQRPCIRSPCRFLRLEQTDSLLRKKSMLLTLRWQHSCRHHTGHSHGPLRRHTSLEGIACSLRMNWQLYLEHRQRKRLNRRQSRFREGRLSKQMSPSWSSCSRHTRGIRLLPPLQTFQQGTRRSPLLGVQLSLRCNCCRLLRQQQILVQQGRECKMLTPRRPHMCWQHTRCTPLARCLRSSRLRMQCSWSLPLMIYLRCTNRRSWLRPRMQCPQHMECTWWSLQMRQTCFQHTRCKMKLPLQRSYQHRIAGNLPR